MMKVLYQKYFIIAPSSGIKVYVNLTSKRSKMLGLSLYRPYSFKGRILVTIIGCVNTAFLKLFLGQEIEVARIFSKLSIKGTMNVLNASYLNSQNGSKTIVVSRVNSEVVVLKFSDNIGLVEREIAARKSLSNKIAIPQLVDEGLTCGKRFISFEYVEGPKTKIQEGGVRQFVKALQTSEEYMLGEHPKVINLLSILHALESPVNPAFFERVRRSNIRIKLVFEHGDFTQWNIKMHKNGIFYFFDWESLDENGIEFFDLIHFYFTEQVFLRKKLETFLFYMSNLSVPDIVIYLYLLNRLYVKGTDKEEIKDMVINYLAKKSIIHAD